MEMQVVVRRGGWWVGVVWCGRGCTVQEGALLVTMVVECCMGKWSRVCFGECLCVCMLECLLGCLFVSFVACLFVSFLGCLFVSFLGCSFEYLPGEDNLVLLSLQTNSFFGSLTKRMNDNI